MILLGAGGHAKTLIEGISHQLIGYIDPHPAPWLSIPRLPDDYDLKNDKVIIGFVGLTTEAFERRYGKMTNYIFTTAGVPPLIHPTAIVHKTAEVQSGVQVLPGAIVNAYATLKSGCIINTGAVVEHDATIMDGTHIAPHATVLGGALVGRYCFIGDGAIVIQGTPVPDSTFIKAGTVWK